MKKKIKKLLKILPIIFGVIIFMTGIMTYKNLGFNKGFYSSWIKSFFLVLFIVLPINGFFIRKLFAWIEKYFKHRRNGVRKTYFAFLVGIFLPSFMAFVTTIGNGGIGDNFFNSWLLAFISTVPIGIIFGFVVGIFLLPRLQKGFVS